MTKLGDKPVLHNGRGKFHPDHRIRIRRAGCADILPISLICKERYYSLYGRYTSVEAMEYYLRPFATNTLRKERKAWYVLRIGHRVEGCIKLENREIVLAIDKFYLSSGASGRQLGAHVLKKVLPPHIGVVVQVYLPNRGAWKFFTRQDFQMQGPCRWSFRGQVQTGIQLKRRPQS